MSQRKRAHGSNTATDRAKRRRKENAAPEEPSNPLETRGKVENSDKEVETEIYAFSPARQAGMEFPMVCHAKKTKETSTAGAAASGTSENTPMKHSSVHTNNIASCGTTTEEAIKNRKADAQKLVDTYLTRNIEGIIDLAAPCDKEAKQSADLVACKTADALE
ncbi:hypothetical protein LPJ56_001075, partial [Coemansia sp. RSA 2599]